MTAHEATKIIKDGIEIAIIAHAWGTDVMPECVTLAEPIALGIEFPEPEAPKPQYSAIVPVMQVTALGWEFA